MSNKHLCSDFSVSLTSLLKPKDAAYVLIQIQKLALSIFFLEINLEMITKAVLDFM